CLQHMKLDAGYGRCHLRAPESGGKNFAFTDPAGAGNDLRLQEFPVGWHAKSGLTSSISKVWGEDENAGDR
ncbi:MAG: hypothetical protein VW057_00905, partial [Rhodospirillaceae bacterium]